jgi:ribonucleoside-diphosphate reductase alpha chain
MKGYDAFAGAIKSGGKTRRAAKMVILNIDHPDIMDFIWCKAKEEEKARALIALGYDGSIDGNVYANTFFQNANNSARVTDEFMRAVREDGNWQTKFVTNGETSETFKARDVMRAIAEATWQCGDPGIQFDTTTNRWHTCQNSGRINASNPCSEFMFLDDSACNLASLNLMRFYNAETGVFDIESFKHAVAVILTAQEIFVSDASYPTEAIEKNSYEFRPLGLGYANLGALLMANGLAYDSDEGRNYAAAVTSLMTGYAYYISACIAQRKGPFKHYVANKDPFMNVIGMHTAHARKIGAAGVPAELLTAVNEAWLKAQEAGTRHGFRNAQVTLLAPTGTIGFIMDCDTTGIEPEMALVKYKWLVGGGMMKIVNGTTPLALKRLGYTREQIDAILRYIEEKGTIEGAPGLRQEHLSVFDCAFKPANGSRFIHYMGHIKMMAAVQQFLSGAISKTVNMPKESTNDDIMEAYMQAWQLGLKSIAVYRDGSKGVQPLTLSKDTKAATKEKEVQVVRMPIRRKLPPERKAITHRFDIAGYRGYLTVGMYEDGTTPGEIFITISKEGSTISGLMDAFATSISIALQYGVPLRTLVKKFIHTRYEPSGMTDNPEIRIAKSITDYIFRWMALKFLSQEDQLDVGVNLDLTEATKLDSYLDESETQGTVEINKKEAAPAQSAPTASTSSSKQLGTDGNGVSGSTSTTIKSSSQTTQPVPRLMPTGKKQGATSTFQNSEDALACYSCGAIMVRSGSCYKCLNCGTTSGCS